MNVSRLEFILVIWDSKIQNIKLGQMSRECKEGAWFLLSRLVKGELTSIDNIHQG